MKNQKQQSYVSILKSLLCPQPDSWLYEKEKKRKDINIEKKIKILKLQSPLIIKNE